MITLNIIYVIVFFHNISYHTDRNNDLVSALRKTHTNIIKHYPAFDLDDKLIEHIKLYQINTGKMDRPKHIAMIKILKILKGI